MARKRTANTSIQCIHGGSYKQVVTGLTYWAEKDLLLLAGWSCLDSGRFY